MQSTWLHARPSLRGDLDACFIDVETPDALRVAIVDPYYGTTQGLPPLDKVVSLLPPDVAEMDVIVFRDTDALQLNGRQASDVASSLISRFGRTFEIATLSSVKSDSRYRMTCAHVSGPDYGWDARIGQLRQLEFRAQVNRSGALYRPARAHVVLPSGAHADAYLRIADIFDDAVFVRRAADWLDDRVDAQTILLADTWTILPLMQELSRRHIAKIGEPRHAPAPPIHTFSAYPNMDEVRRTFEQIGAQSVARSGRLLFVISVLSSGGLLRNVRALCERYLPGIELDVVAIANTDLNVAVNSLFTVSDIRRFEPSLCELCAAAETQPRVSIDTKRYFPTFRGSRRVEMITQPLAQQHSSFWELASNCQAVKVHAWVTPAAPSQSEEKGLDPKHRTVAIDVTTLLEKSLLFREGALDSLAAFLPRCDVVIVPSPYVANSLLGLAKQLYPDVVPIELPAPWHTAGRELLRNQLAGARRILLLDDAIVSGKTIRVLHRVLQDLIHELDDESRPAPGYTISAFAIIGRPQSDTQWKRLEASLRQGRGPSLGCYQRIDIPDGNCPWCEERSRLEEVRRRIGSAALFGSSLPYDTAEALNSLDLRLALLNKPQRQGVSGMDQALFVCGPEGELGDRAPDHLTWNSLFGQHLSEAATFGAVATAMHSVRLAAIERQHDRQAVAWEWEWAARILTAYHDPLIQASFLRAARAEELRMELTPELNAAIKEAFYAIEAPSRRVSPMLAAEHKLAAVMQKYAAPVRHLILECANSALEHQAVQVPAIRPVLDYLRVLEGDLLLPTQRVEQGEYGRRS